jgi:hypothetical protein
MAPSSDYRTAYETAKQELADLLAKKQEVEKRIVVVRQSLQTLATLCEGEGVQIVPSRQASYLLENSTTADEIRMVLKAAWPGYLRPNVVKANLERLGRDLSQYQNPQATIQMVLKRMVESGEAQEGTIPEDGKKAYRLSSPYDTIASLAAGVALTAEIGHSIKQVVRAFTDAEPNQRQGGMTPPPKPLEAR